MAAKSVWIGHQIRVLAATKKQENGPLKKKQRGRFISP
jgi:hypothetical protein